jgi:voltage-gated potassium channel
MSDVRLRRWQDETDEWLLVAAAIFLVAYAIPIVHPSLPAWLDHSCQVIIYAVWATFVVDLVVRVCLAERRGRYLLSNWFDLLIIALPLLRPLRAVRALLLISVLTRRGQPFVRGKVVQAVAVSGLGLCGIAALAVLDAERNAPGANIVTVGDAAWWTATTVTTVGYGDKYPTTVEGRFIAVSLMVLGLALLGVITAAIASWFVERISEVKASEDQTQVMLAEVRAGLVELRQALAALDQHHDSLGPAPDESGRATGSETTQGDRRPANVRTATPPRSRHFTDNPQT